MKPRDILEHFQSRHPAMIESIREIVEIESPSHDVERSREVTACIERQARDIDLDLQVEKTFAEGDGEHLVIRAFPSDNKSVLLLGHTDTVHPVGAKALNPTRIEDGRFYG